MLTFLQNYYFLILNEFRDFVYFTRCLGYYQTVIQLEQDTGTN